MDNESIILGSNQLSHLIYNERMKSLKGVMYDDVFSLIKCDNSESLSSSWRISLLQINIFLSMRLFH